MGARPRVDRVPGRVVDQDVTGVRVPNRIASLELDPRGPAGVARHALPALVVGELAAFGKPPRLRVRIRGCADVVRRRCPAGGDTLGPVARETRLPQHRAGTEGQAGGQRDAAHYVSPGGASSTSRTLRASAGGVNGFCKKLSPGSSMPWCTIASSV